MLQQKTTRLEIDDVERMIFPNIDTDTSNGMIYETVRYWGNSFDDQEIILSNECQIYFWIRDYRDKLKEE